MESFRKLQIYTIKRQFKQIIEKIWHLIFQHSPYCCKLDIFQYIGTFLRNQNSYHLMQYYFHCLFKPGVRILHRAIIIGL